MADSDRRLRYYNGQVLQQEDFIDEQAYHLDRLRRHLRQLHTSGIAEGLTVTANVGASSVTVQPGTAIDNEGRPIVLVAPRTVPLGALTGSALVMISYRESSAVPATMGDQGHTRWLEDPDVEVIQDGGAPPAAGSIPLARLQVDGAGAVASQDPSVRTPAGAKLGPEVAIERIRLSRQGVATSQWPVLSSGAPNQADVTGSLSVAGNVLVTGTVDGRDVSADGAKLDAHTASTNNPHNTTAAQVQAITGVGGVSNPGGNIDLVGQAGITIAVDISTKKITIANAAGNLTVPNPLGASPQYVRDQNGNQSNLAIGTGKNVGIGTNTPGYFLTVAGNILAAPLVEIRNQNNEASIRYVNNDGIAWHAGSGGGGGAKNFFFWNDANGIVVTVTPAGALTVKNLNLMEAALQSTAPVPSRLRQLLIDPVTGQVYRAP